jgi:NAD(P)-dependent dehydrogenase (short-subunit alcohol dehydrogenase family)
MRPNPVSIALSSRRSSSHITGSDSGIGQGTAIEFAKEGADVVVHYLADAVGAEKTRKAVEGQGVRAVVVQADISGGVDASGKDVADLPTETWDKAIRTNLYGAFFCWLARRPLRVHAPRALKCAGAVREPKGFLHLRVSAG